MSFDLTFAKPKRRIPKKQIADAYNALARSEPGDVFEHLPVDDILNGLCAAYEDFEPAVKFRMFEDGRGSAEMFGAPCRFSFSFRDDTSDMQERIIGIFRGFGCPVYDPQFSTLYPLEMFRRLARRPQRVPLFETTDQGADTGQARLDQAVSRRPLAGSVR